MKTLLTISAAALVPTLLTIYVAYLVTKSQKRIEIVRGEIVGSLENIVGLIQDNPDEDYGDTPNLEMVPEYVEEDNVDIPGEDYWNAEGK